MLISSSFFSSLFCVYINYKVSPVMNYLLFILLWQMLRMIYLFIFLGRYAPFFFLSMLRTTRPCLFKCEVRASHTEPREMHMKTLSGVNSRSWRSRTFHLWSDPSRCVLIPNEKNPKTVSIIKKTHSHRRSPHTEKTSTTNKTLGFDWKRSGRNRSNGGWSNLP